MTSRFLELAKTTIQNTSNHDEIIAAVAGLLARLTAEERRRCAALCRSRAELWRRTPSAHAAVPGAREEARARANEAAYLADLIESNQEIASGNGEPN